MLVAISVLFSPACNGVMIRRRCCPNGDVKLWRSSSAIGKKRRWRLPLRFLPFSLSCRRRPRGVGDGGFFPNFLERFPAHRRGRHWRACFSSLLSMASRTGRSSASAGVGGRLPVWPRADRRLLLVLRLYHCRTARRADRSHYRNGGSSNIVHREAVAASEAVLCGDPSRTTDPRRRNGAAGQHCGRTSDIRDRRLCRPVPA